MKLPSKVQNVVFGKTCRREAVKAAQRFNLRLLEYDRGGWSRMKVRAVSSPEDVRFLGKNGNGAFAGAYLGLSLAVFLTVGKLGAHGAMQPWHGRRGYCGAGRRVGQYRRIGFVFGSCRGALLLLLALFECAKPGRELRPVGEEPASVDEAQATALELGARFSDLRHA